MGKANTFRAALAVLAILAGSATAQPSAEWERTLDVVLVDSGDDAPLGVGEASCGPVGAAIGNALRDALGVRVCDLPLTREGITAAIEQETAR